jgi:ribosome maturation factor RimP
MAPPSQPGGRSGQRTDEVASLLRPVVADGGLVLEGVTVTPAGKRRVVRVVVDLPDDAVGSVDLDRVADVSHTVSDALDATDVLGGAPYVLEVGTPGVDRPLTERRHWSRARTRLVAVTAGGQELTGRVLQVDDDGVVLEVDGAARTLAWADLGPGRVQVEFSRKDDGATDEAADDADDDEKDEED